MAEIRNEYGGCSIERCINFERREGYMENMRVVRVISFEAFSMMVDEALERMKKMLESNKAMQTLVSGEAGETVEKDM